jgi:hypothetical protein
MLALLAMMGMENIHAMNALKTVLATCINGMAVITFGGWRGDRSKALFMISGAIWGLWRAYYAQKLIPSGASFRHLNGISSHYLFF